jgi:hypothetical protein
MSKHIKRHYKEVVLEKAVSKNQEAVNQQIRQLYRQAQQSGDAKDFYLEVLEASLDATVITEALISLIVVLNLSYNMVE